MKGLKLFFLGSCLLLPAGINAQHQDTVRIRTGDNLLYMVQARQSFMIPYIESLLKDLTGEGDRKLFSKVTSLNVLSKTVDVTAQVYKTFSIFNTSKTEVKEKVDAEQNKKISQELLKHKWILRIDINELNSLLEYQFILFKIPPDTVQKATAVSTTTSAGSKPKQGGGETDKARESGKDETLTIYNPDRDYYRSTSVFIDPSSKDYREKLQYSLRQLFFEANKSPVPSIVSSIPPVKDTIYAPIGDSLKLEALYQDNDSPPEKIRYHWNLSPLRGYNVPSYNPYSVTQSLALRDTGTYELYLTIADENKESAKKLFIRVIPRLEIYRIRDQNQKDEDELFFPFAKYRNKINENNYLQVTLENANKPKCSFKVYDSRNNEVCNFSYSKKDSLDNTFDIYRVLTDNLYEPQPLLKKIRSSEFCIIKPENSNYFYLFPYCNPNRSMKYRLELTVTDIGNQVRKETRILDFRCLARWSASLRISDYRIKRKYAASSTLIGAMYRIAGPVAIESSFGTLTAVNTKQDSNAFSFFKPVNLTSLHLKLEIPIYPKLIGNLSLKGNVFSYPYYYGKEHKYMVSLGISIDYGYKIIGKAGALDLAFIYSLYPYREHAFSENMNKIKFYELGGKIGYTWFKRYKKAG